MTETAKERIYRETLEKTRDRLDGFQEQYADKEVYSAFDELTGLVEKGLKQASEIPVRSDKLLIEKLQERCDRYEKALTEIEAAVAEFADDGDYNFNFAGNLASEALAAIGGDDD